MSDYRVLLDAFAEARRSWDDLVALQPDVMAGSGNLELRNLAELGRRISAHREAVETLAAALDLTSSALLSVPVGQELP